MSNDTINVLMVCLGNICRSPTAEAVFRECIKREGLEGRIHVDSAGTGSWHTGHPPDERAARAALARDYDMSALRARQVCVDDFSEYDYIFAMDKQNLEDLLALCDPALRHKVSLFLQHGGRGVEEVPDPYYSGPEGFELVLDLVEDAAGNLVRHLADTHRLV